jgi:hypothetical protein
MRPFTLLLALAALVLTTTATATAQLPEMPAVEPVTKPPVEQITYDSWFLKTLVVRSDMDTCQVTLIVRRYNYDRKLLSPDDADERTVTIANAYPLAKQYTLWQQVMGVIVQGAALAVQEDEYMAKIADVVARIEAARMEDENADVSALEAEKKTLQSGLDAVQQKMGPVGTGGGKGAK